MLQRGWISFERSSVAFQWMNLTCWSAPGSRGPQHHPEKTTVFSLDGLTPRCVISLVAFTVWVWRLCTDTLLLLQFELFTHRTTPASSHGHSDKPRKHIYKIMPRHHFSLWNQPDVLDRLDLGASTGWLFLANLSEAHHPSRKDFLCPPLSLQRGGNERPRLWFCKLWGELCGTLHSLNSSWARSCPSLQMHSCRDKWWRVL